MEKIKGLYCILLVDDDTATNVVNRIIINRLNLNTHIEVTLNGKQAMDYLTYKGQYNYSSTHPPQPGIIFLDINMPLMNGWEFIAEYDKLPKEQKENIIVVMVSSSLNPEDKKRAASNSTITKFVSKPLNREVIEKLVEENFLLWK
jgi:CheY-like chemotaxis protein